MPDAAEGALGEVRGIGVVAGTVFSAISGSTIATTAMLGSLMLPVMLARGYSLTRGADGRLIASVAGLAAGEKVTVTLRDGELDARVEELRKKGDE